MSSPTAAPAAYIPGVCNINHAEIARRRMAGYIGLAIFVVMLAVLLFLPVLTACSQHTFCTRLLGGNWVFAGEE